MNNRNNPSRNYTVSYDNYTNIPIIDQPSLLHNESYFKNKKTRSKHQCLKSNFPKNPAQNDIFPDQNDTVSEWDTQSALRHAENSFGKKSQSNLIDLQSRYKTIQSFLQCQNQNLKQQNHMLLSQVKKISNNQKKYKEMYYKCKQQRDILQQQRDVYRAEVQELKLISRTQLKKLQRKLNYVSMQDSNSQSPSQSIQYDRKSRNRQVSATKLPEQFTNYTNTD